MSTKAVSTRFDNVQALRGVAALMVVCTHAMAFERKYIRGDRLLADWMEIGTSGVDLFFVISGFIMVHVTRGAFQQPAAIGEFVFHRLRRIYPIYWIYSALVLAVLFVKPQWVNESQGHLADGLRSFLLLPQAGMPLLQPAWSLVFEIYFYALFAGLLFLPERYAPRAIVLWAVAAPSACFLFGHFQSPLLALVTSPYCIEFALGCLVAFVAASGRIRLGVLPAVTAAVVVSCLAASAMWFGAQPEVPWRVAIYGIPYALLVYVFVAGELSGAVRSPRWLVRIGDWSYSLYLSHFLVIAGAVRLWAVFDVNGILDNAVLIALTIAGTLAWARLSYVYLERPMLRGSAALWERLVPGPVAPRASR